MALASVPQGASGLPASAVPTVLERFPGFVRCVMDIAPEVVGWVIGRSGAHIKEMKVRCGAVLLVQFQEICSFTFDMMRYDMYVVCIHVRCYMRCVFCVSSPVRLCAEIYLWTG